MQVLMRGMGRKKLVFVGFVGFWSKKMVVLGAKVGFWGFWVDFEEGFWVAVPR